MNYLVQVFDETNVRVYTVYLYWKWRGEGGYNYIFHRCEESEVLM